MALALDLDDAALALATGDGPARVAPAVVRAQAGVAPIGAPALDELRRRPREVSTRHWLRLAEHEGMPAAAALVRAELDARCAAAGLDAAARAAAGEVVVAVPPQLDSAALGYVLAALRAAGLAVGRFVDSAALRCAALDLERDALVLDAGLHHLGVAAVRRRGNELRRTAVRWRASGGELALREAWLQLAAEAMVLRHRFDPLHDGATEQQLFDLLPAAAARAASTGSATLALERAGQRLEVELTRDQFAARAQAPYRELLDMLHSLRPAGAELDLVVSERIAAWPGLVEQLDGLHGCRLHVLPDGFAARAALQLAAEPRGSAATGVPLVRSVARFAAASSRDGVSVRMLGAAGGRAAAPTHVLHAGRALSLRGAVLEIGRGPAARGIALPEGTAGLSRLHCTLRDEAGEIVLVDHSRHGSWVNGERVVDRTRLRAGDTLRVGDPGIELTLIALGAETAGSPPG